MSDTAFLILSGEERTLVTFPHWSHSCESGHDGQGGALVTIWPCGKVTLRAGMEFDEAARAFWEAVERMAPHRE